jgi:hypothetical protein
MSSHREPLEAGYWTLHNHLVVEFLAPYSILSALQQRITLAFNQPAAHVEIYSLRWSPDEFEKLNRFYQDVPLSDYASMYSIVGQHELFRGRNYFHSMDVSAKTGYFYYFDSENNSYLLNHYPFLTLAGRLLNTAGFAPIHAAVIGYGSTGIIMPGESLTGKSTTSLSWTLGGGWYTSEDFVFLNPGHYSSAYGFYKGIKIRSGALKLFQEQGYSNQFQTGLIPIDEDRHIVMHPDYTQHAFRKAADLKAVWLIKTGFEENKISPVSPLEAHRNLMSSLKFSKFYHLNLRTVNQVIKSVSRSLPCFEVQLTSNLRQNTDYLTKLIKELE